jgi:hypothetical protein
MPQNRRVAAGVAACVFTALFPVCASAQDGGLKLPTIVAATAATSDWTTTYHALKHYDLREANPFLQPWQESPRSLISVGGLLDVGGITAWNLTVGRRNARVAVAGLWTMAAFRTVVALHNIRNAQKARPR